VELEPGDAQKGAQVALVLHPSPKPKRSIQRTGLMVSPEVILESMYWIPLVALLVSSLGLVALKRVSGLPLWLERVAAPPFYFVSFPVATLLAGAELLIWTGADVYYFGWAFVCSLLFVVWDSFSVDPAGTLGAFGYANFCVAPFAVLFLSGYMLWRTIGRQRERSHSSGVAMRPLRTLVPLFVFVWAFLTLRDNILSIAPSSLHLRVF
jgi:hypothetical protein